MPFNFILSLSQRKIQIFLVEDVLVALFLAQALINASVAQKQDNFLFGHRTFSLTTRKRLQQFFPEL